MEFFSPDPCDTIASFNMAYLFSVGLRRALIPNRVRVIEGCIVQLILLPWVSDLIQVLGSYSIVVEDD